MPSVKIEIKNMSAIKKAFYKSPELMTNALNMAIRKGLISIQGETILNVGGQRGIRVITHGLASAAQRPPIFTNLKGVYDVDIEYAVFVHEGTKFMRSRPFLRQAVETKEDEVNRFFTEATDSVLSDIGKGTK